MFAEIKSITKMKNNKIQLTLSDGAEVNYVATVTKIKNITPIEGSDNLMQTVISGFNMVISKDMKVGDIVIHCMINSVLNQDFLAANNLFDSDNLMLNHNHEEVMKLIEKGDKEGAKRLIGFFNSQGRVKTINLRSVPSQGFICDFNTIRNWMPDLEINDEEKLVGTTFDTINDVVFIQKYVPLNKPHKTNSINPFKKIGKFNRLIDNQFNFHYDTKIINKYIDVIKPDSNIHISIKKHGTSIIMSKVLTNIKLKLYQKILKLFGNKNIKTIGYGSIYSSASIIRNKYAYNNQVDTFSGVDIYANANRIVYPLLSDGMTVYGELYGYVPDTTKLIQKGYDYGCKPGQYFILPYRITTTTDNGSIYEWDVDEVIDWTLKQIKDNPKLKNIIKPLETLYSGLAKDLYPNIPIDENWSYNFLEALKSDKHFYMEENDPHCKNNVPFEGIVIKFNHAHKSEAFKLKCQRFYMKEQKDIDKGEIDMETEEKLNNVNS